MPGNPSVDLTTVAARLARLRERRGFAGIFGSGSHLTG